MKSECGRVRYPRSLRNAPCCPDSPKAKPVSVLENIGLQRAHVLVSRRTSISSGSLSAQRQLGFPRDPANTAAARNLTWNHAEAIHYQNTPNGSIVVRSPQALHSTYSAAEPCSLTPARSCGPPGPEAIDRTVHPFPPRFGTWVYLIVALCSRSPTSS